WLEVSPHPHRRGAHRHPAAGGQAEACHGRIVTTTESIAWINRNIRYGRRIDPRWSCGTGSDMISRTSLVSLLSFVLVAGLGQASAATGATTERVSLSSVAA